MSPWFTQQQAEQKNRDCTILREKISGKNPERQTSFSKCSLFVALGPFPTRGTHLFFFFYHGLIHCTTATKAPIMFVFFIRMCPNRQLSCVTRTGPYKTSPLRAFKAEESSEMEFALRFCGKTGSSVELVASAGICSADPSRATR